LSHRIEVGFKPDYDILGNNIKREIVEDLHILVDSVRTVDVYTIDKKLSKKQLSLLGRELFADPVIQIFSYDKPLAHLDEWVIEVTYKPRVTDPHEENIRKGIKDLLREEFKSNEVVSISKQYLISGNLKMENIFKIADELLANKIIQDYTIVSKITKRH